VWIAQCESGLARSTDGVTFSPVVFLGRGANIGIFHEGAYFFAVHRNAIFASQDGLQWTPLPIYREGDPTQIVAYGNGTYVFVGQDLLLHASGDLVHWETGYFPATVSSVIFENGTFLAYAVGGVVLASTDGKYWKEAKVQPPYVMTHGGGRFVNLSDSQVFTSTDGLTWTGVPYQGFFRYPYTVAYGAGRFVGATEQGLLVTLDGSSWQALWPWAGTNQYPQTRPRYQPEAQRFSAVVGSWSPQGGYWALRLSEDGKVWSEHLIQPLTPNSSFGDGAATAGNGQWVMVGALGQDGAWASSTDLVSWNSGSIPGISSLLDVTYGDGRYVAVGAGGAIATSTDGTHWAVVESPTTHQLTRVVFGHGKFIAVGGAFLESDDGLTWNGGGAGGGRVIDISVLPFGFSLLGDYGKLTISYDGVTWLDLGEGMSIRSALYPWMGHYLTLVDKSPSTFAVTDDFVNWSYVYSNLINSPLSITSNGETLVVNDSAFASGCLGPGIASAAPSAGPGEGGNPVTVRGAGLSACDSVFFGQTPAPSFTIDSDIQITAIAPAYAGTDSVRITVSPRGDYPPSGWFYPYTYILDPVVTGRAPSVLSTAGREGFALGGFGFGTNASIGLGGEVYPLVGQVTMQGGLTGMTQPLPAGTYDLVVRPQDGTSLTVPDALTYADPPTITAVGFQDNPPRLIITGSGFQPACTAQIDGLGIGLKKYKGNGKIVVMASGLKKLLPKGKAHAISVVNPDGLVSLPLVFHR
jgi:hypothetical protein